MPVLRSSPQDERAGTTVVGSYYLQLRGADEPERALPGVPRAGVLLQVPDGGRVFFDELGPPWLKHSCTDNSPGSRVPRVKTSHHLERPEWDREGCTPLRVVSLTEGVFEVGRRKISDWWVLEERDLRAGRALQVLLDADIGVRDDELLYISEWDEKGMAFLSWLSGPASEAFEYFAWHPDHFAGISVAQFHEFDDRRRRERGLAALAALFETLPRERNYAYFDKRSKEQILSAVVEAIDGAQRGGWQRRRESVNRMEEAVRDGLGYWNHGWLAPQ